MALKKGKEKKPVTLFYYGMFRQECSAKDIAVLSGLAEDKTEVWIQSNICELILTNDSLVFEDAAEDFTCEEDTEFLKEKGIVSVYAITYLDTDKEKAEQILDTVISQKDGILCSDTEDFQPVVKGSF